MFWIFIKIGTQKRKRLGETCEATMRTSMEGKNTRTPRSDPWVWRSIRREDAEGAERMRCARHVMGERV